MTSLNTPHPEFYYNNMNEYIQDKYAELDKDPTITGKRKEFIKNQNRQLNGSNTNNRGALLADNNLHQSSKI